MASGQVVGQILDVMPPAATLPQITVRAGGSTPAERVLVYAFDAATIEYLDFKVAIRGYAGGGFTVDYYWSAASATSGVCRWSGAFRRVADDAEDIDASQTYDYNDTDCTAATVSGEVAYDTVTFTDGADADSVANGDICIFRVRRNASHANDTMTGDAELWGILIRES